MSFILGYQRVFNNLHPATKNLPRILNHGEKASHTFNSLSDPLQDVNSF